MKTTTITMLCGGWVQSREIRRSQYAKLCQVLKVSLPGLFFPGTAVKSLLVACRHVLEGLLLGHLIKPV